MTTMTPTPKLYKVTFQDLAPRYVVALDPTAAYEVARRDMDAKNYGFQASREMKTVELIADTYEHVRDLPRLHIQGEPK